VDAKNAATFRFDSVSEEQFRAAPTHFPQDRFARTFVSKAKLSSLWPALGVWSNGSLCGAIAWTVSRQVVANLQLLHVFHAWRRRGVGSLLCYEFLAHLLCGRATHFRVSSEPGAVAFYRSLGIVFQGRQKSGCLLSVGRLEGDTFATCDYTATDPVIQSALHSKGRGGCVEVF
jgi:ribosomal protein S18 acetylase RimI-like enzyme